MTNFAKDLETQFIQRRAAARLAAQQAKANNSLPTEIDAFEIFVQTRLSTVLGMFLHVLSHPDIRNRPSEMPVVCDTCGDNHACFDTLPQWQAFLRTAASAGVRVHKARHITPLTDEELSKPENRGFGRIGGRPSGVVVTLHAEKGLRDMELQVLNFLPSLAEVKADFTRVVEARDVSSYGNGFSVEYPLPVSGIEQVICATNAWRLFAAACAELGLTARVTRERLSYFIKVEAVFQRM